MTSPPSSKIDELKAEAARRDFAYYCDYVHGRPLYRHQVMWAKELTQTASKILITAPPGSYKSTTTRMLVEWSIGNNIEETNLLVMNTATQAQRQVMSIAETITSNSRYRLVFPWVIPNPKRGWSHETLFVQRENDSNPDAAVYGTGIDGPYQGVHVDRIVIDDPTDQRDVYSDATMGQQRERLHGVLIDRVNPGGSVYSILTRWGEADLYRDFKEMGFMMLECPAEGRYQWGRLLWPEVFSDDKLQEIRYGKGEGAGLGGQLYQLTFMCDPSAAEGALLKREWWKFYSERPEVERVVHSWDLSTGRSTIGDYSAFQCWSRTKNGYYLLDAGRWRLDMDDLVQKMRLLYEQSNPRPQTILVEEAGTSIPIVQYLQRNTRMPIMAIKPGSRDKVSRVRGIQALVEAGRVWLPAVAPWLTDFLDECAAFPGGRYDDQVDAMSQALSHLDKGGSGYRQGYSFERREPKRGWEPAITSFARKG